MPKNVLWLKSSEDCKHKKLNFTKIQTMSMTKITIFLLKEIFIATSHDDISRYKGNNSYLLAIWSWNIEHLQFSFLVKYVIQKISCLQSSCNLLPKPTPPISTKASTWENMTFYVRKNMSPLLLFKQRRLAVLIQWHDWICLHFLHSSTAEAVTYFFLT